MAIKVLVNGNPGALISVQDRGLQYGDGLFETIAVDEHRPLCLKTHLARLKQGCETLALPPPDLAQLTEELLALAELAARAVLKITITRGCSTRGYHPPAVIKPNRIVALYDWPKQAATNAQHGINVRFCNYRYSDNPNLAGIKHLNRLEQVLARTEWDDQQFAEGIMLNRNGDVIEATASNLFYVMDNTLVTPDLSQCGVAGVIRAEILTLAAQLGTACHIEKVSVQSLLAADEVFLCNSIMGICPVKKIAEQCFTIGKWTRKIQAQLQAQHSIARLC